VEQAPAQPEPAETVPAEPTPEAPQTARLSYTVQSGDTLWSIAANPEVYNNPYLWPLIFATNREHFRDPDNPALIEPGQILEIPNPGNSQFYSVQSGDSLTSIAADPDIYNDPERWAQLYDTNRDRMANPENPHLLLPGMVLEIPKP
jgi:nucleoid-associated protein YgaU